MHLIVAVSQPTRRRKPYPEGWRRPKFTVTCSCGRMDNSATEHEIHVRSTGQPR